MDRKRFIILILFIIVTFLLGYLMYRVFFAPTKPAVKPGITTGVTSTDQLPTAGEGGIKTDATIGTTTLPTIRPGQTVTKPTVVKEPIVKKIVDTSIKNAMISKSGQINFYNQQDGKLYRLKKDGTAEAISSEVFHNVDKVTWSPKSDGAILEYPDGSNIYFNSATNEQVTLPKHWEDFSFSPTGDKIAAKSIALSPENRWLVTSDPDGNNIQNIESMGNNADKVTVDWSPNQQVVGFSLTGQALGMNRQEVLLVGTNNENFKSLTVEGRGFESQWSPSGKSLIYSVYSQRSDYKPEIWIVGAEGDNIGSGRKLLTVNTWADKCTFADERFVYCAVPSIMPTGAGFAPRVADNIADVIYRLDTQTGARTPVATDGSHTVGSILISDDQSTLYFTDKNQQGLFEVKL